MIQQLTLIKNKKLFFAVFLLSIFNSKIYSEEKTLFSFNWVDVPDSISTLLAKEYMVGNCNAEHNVRNMTIRNDVEFQPDVYVYNENHRDRYIDPTKVC